MFPELEEIRDKLDTTNDLLKKIEEHLRVPDLIKWAKTKREEFLQH